MKKVDMVKQLQEECNSTFMQTDLDPEDLNLYEKLMHISIELRNQTRIQNETLMQKSNTMVK